MHTTTQGDIKPTEPTDGEQADDYPTIEEVETDRYGVPTAAHDELARASENYMAWCDHRDTLLTNRTLLNHFAYPEGVPEDPVGVYEDVRTGRLVQVGKDEREGWIVSCDYHTHEMNVIEVGRIVPAIQSRRLVPASRERPARNGEKHRVEVTA